MQRLALLPFRNTLGCSITVPSDEPLHTGTGYLLWTKLKAQLKSSSTISDNNSNSKSGEEGEGVLTPIEASRFANNNMLSRCFLSYANIVYVYLLC